MSNRDQIHLLQGRPLRLRLCRSARARNLRLTVSRRGGAVITLPRWATRRDVDRVLVEAQDWLVRQVTLHDVWDGPRQRSWTSGSELTVLGRRVRLELRPLTDGRRRRRAALTADALRLDLPIDEFLDPRPALERWLRGFAGGHLRERTRAFGCALGLQPGRILVGERRTRWGSCSGRGTISYCYRLVMAPAAVVDAVVIHELCHLVHPDHGPRWRAMVEAACPQHEEHMAWLRRHGEDLEL